MLSDPFGETARLAQERSQGIERGFALPLQFMQPFMQQQQKMGMETELQKQKFEQEKQLAQIPKAQTEEEKRLSSAHAAYFEQESSWLKTIGDIASGKISADQVPDNIYIDPDTQRPVSSDSPGALHLKSITKSGIQFQAPEDLNKKIAEANATLKAIPGGFGGMFSSDEEKQARKLAAQNLVKFLGMQQKKSQDPYNNFRSQLQKGEILIKRDKKIVAIKPEEKQTSDEEL